MLFGLKLPKLVVKLWAKHRTPLIVVAVAVLVFSDAVANAVIKAAFVASYLVLLVIAVRYVRLTRAAGTGDPESSATP